MASVIRLIEGIFSTGSTAFLIVLFLAAVVLLLAIIVLMQLAVRQRRLEKELAVQCQRVLVRKQKIREQQQALLSLTERLRQAERLLQESYSPDEIRQKQRDASGIRNELSFKIKSLSVSDGEKEDMLELLRQLGGLFGQADDAQQPADDGSGQPAPHDSRDGYIGSRILVVDDNYEILKQMTEVLEKGGLLVETALSGEQAVEKYSKSREGYYALIIMDIVMDGMKGYEAAKLIRSMYRSDSESIPIIAVSANNFSEDLVMIQNAGMNERLVKPIANEKLFSVLKKWLGAAKAPESSKAETEVWHSLHASQKS